MNGSEYRSDDLGEILGNYGGLKSEMASYETEDPTVYAIQFRAKCPSGKTVHFWQAFFSVDGSWHPSFGDLKSPPPDPFPAATAPAEIAGTPIPRESC
jgi:hypothetical protein